MSDTPYSPIKPPKTITKIEDDPFADLKSPFVRIFIVFVCVSLYMFSNLGKTQTLITQVAIIIVLVGWIYIWIKYFSTRDKTEKHLLALNFRFMDIKGHHVMNKFDSDDETLQKIVPIVNIHKGGIIEFKGKKWGILMDLNPKRISDEEREAHEKKMEKVVNGIPANTHFKTIACSRLEPRKPIMQYLLDISSKSNGKKATDQHLASLYNKIASDETPVISWKYYAFQSLGEQKSLDAAKIQYNAVIPGLLNNMKGLSPVIIEDPEKVAMAYRTMMSEMVI